MGKTYQADGTFTVAQLRRACDQARAAFQPFESLDPNLLTHFGLQAEQLPTPAQLKGPRLRFFSLHGELPRTRDGLAPLEEFARRAAVVVGETSTMGVSCRFRRKDGEKVRDDVFAGVAKGVPYLGYQLWNGWGKPEPHHRTERIDFFSRLIDRARLPLTVCPEAGDFFRHAGGEQVRVSSSDHAGPMSLSCPLPGVSLEEALARLSRVVAEWAGPAVPFLSWLINSEYGLGPEQCLEVYQGAVQLTRAMKTTRHHLSGAVSLADVGDLPALTSLASDRRGITVGLCKFGLPPAGAKRKDNEATLNATIRPDGHRLGLVLRRADLAQLALVNQTLGVTFHR